MAIPEDVSPTTPTPTHHIKLANAATGAELFANVVRQDHNGNVVLAPETITRNTFPNQAVRFSQSGGGYADLQPPFQAFEQKTWAGGRGTRTFEQDTTRYFDAGGVLTHVDQQVTLGGLPRWTGGQTGNSNPHETQALMPNTASTLIAYHALYGTGKYVARQFTPTTTFTTEQIIVPVSLLGSAPDDLVVALYSDDGVAAPNAAPDTELAHGTLLTSAFGTEERYRQHVLTLNTPVTLTAGTLYWLVYYQATDGDASNHWEVLAEATSASTARQSSDGLTWTTTTSHRAPCGIILDSAFAKIGYRFFEYKRCLYVVSRPEDGNDPYIYRNGYRGAADSNTGALNKLKDSTQTWGTAITSGIVLLIAGPGSEESQPWRNITGSVNGELTVSPNWNTEHTTATEYVVIGTDFWSAGTVLLGSDPGFPDPHVTGEYVYFAMSDKANLIRYREYNNAGVWTTTQAAENFKADKIVSAQDQVNGKTAVLGYLNAHPNGPSYFKKMYIPPAPGKLYRQIGEVVDTDSPWLTRLITNVTVTDGGENIKYTVDGAFTTGTVATRDLESALSLLSGRQVAVLMKSSIAVTTGQLSLRLSSRTYADQQKRLADYATYSLRDRFEVAGSVSTVSGGTHTDKPKAYDGISGTNETVPLTSSVSLMVIASKKFTAIKIDFSTVNTTGGITLTGKYFNGEVFTSHTITDGTASGGTTFAKNGSITFNMPGDWAQYTANGETGYAFELIASGTILAGTAIAEVAVKDSLALAHFQLGNGRDANATTYQALVLKQNDALGVGYREKFDRVTITMGSVVNAAAASLSMYYFNGEQLTLGSIFSDGTVSGGATLAQTGTLIVSVPSDWTVQTFNGVSAYWLHFQVSADLTDDILLAEVAVQLDEDTIDIDCVLSADVWTWLTKDFDGSGLGRSASAEALIVRNVSLILNANLAAQNIEMHGGVQLISDYPIWESTNGQRMTNIATYGQGDQILEPYLLFENQRLHRIDLLNNDILVPILITSFETLADETNGRVTAHSGPYLYFNMGPRLMRYVDGNVESVGPDLDEGLPHDRQGVISAIIPYAGDQVIYAVNAGQRDPDFTSTIILRGNGTHELYRAPVGEPIRDIRVQVSPGLKSDFLWVNVGSQLIWVPIPSYTRDPLKDLDSDGVSNYPYLHDGYLDLGYFTDNMQGLRKVFVSLSLVTRNLSSDLRWVTAYYRTDDTLTWTKIATDYTISPLQELAFTTNYVNCKKLQVRLRPRRKGGVLTTPVIESVYVKGVSIYPATYLYVLNLLIEDRPEDLTGNYDETTRAETLMSLLDTWRNTGAVLDFNVLASPYDARKVIIQSVGSRVNYLDPQTQKEQHMVQVTLLDITLVSRQNKLTDFSSSGLSDVCKTPLQLNELR